MKIGKGVSELQDPSPKRHFLYFTFFALTTVSALPCCTVILLHPLLLMQLLPVQTVCWSSLTNVTSSSMMWTGISSPGTVLCSFGGDSKSTLTVPVGVMYDPYTHLDKHANRQWATGRQKDTHNGYKATAIFNILPTSQNFLKVNSNSSVKSLMGCLHNPANVQQTSSKCIQNTRANAGRLLDSVNTL